MTPLQELQAQRDFLLRHRWVPRMPAARDEGCLVVRGIFGSRSFRELSTDAYIYIADAIQARDGHSWTPGLWNDNLCSSAGEAIEVLDDAIRRVKEDEVSHG